MRVLVQAPDPAPLAAQLSAAFPAIDAHQCANYIDLPRLLSELRPDAVCSMRYAGTGPFPAAALTGPDGPRWLASAGVGVDHLGRWDPARLTVTNAAGIAAPVMAEFILGGFLHFTLDHAGLIADKAARLWRADRLVRALHGATLLIVGLGSTGQALATRAKALGMRVIGTRARPQPMEGIDRVFAAEDLPQALPQADFIAVCVPLTPATRGLIGAAEIARMRPGAVFADVSRGGVTDQAALLNALYSGHVAGAVLDVFETEPLPPESPLWQAPNTLISPHASAVFDGWQDASFGLFLDNFARFTKGQPLVNVVDPERGY
ncbi:MAG: D-2-hydroxyacid dehydrogenase [Pseudomonadota bacterium]